MQHYKQIFCILSWIVFTLVSPDDHFQGFKCTAFWWKWNRIWIRYSENQGHSPTEGIGCCSKMSSVLNFMFMAGFVTFLFFNFVVFDSEMLWVSLVHLALIYYSKINLGCLLPTHSSKINIYYHHILYAKRKKSHALMQSIFNLWQNPIFNLQPVYMQ